MHHAPFEHVAPEGNSVFYEKCELFLSRDTSITKLKTTQGYLEAKPCMITKISPI